MSRSLNDIYIYVFDMRKNERTINAKRQSALVTNKLWKNEIHLNISWQSKAKTLLGLLRTHIQNGSKRDKQAQAQLQAEACLQIIASHTHTHTTESKARAHVLGGVARQINQQANQTDKQTYIHISRVFVQGEEFQQCLNIFLVLARHFIFYLFGHFCGICFVLC